MTTTIAIVGHNGNVGKKVLPHLIKAHQDGRINLVVLHRSSSAIDSIPVEIERRIMGDDSSLRDVVKGVNILLSTLGPEGLALQEKILDALAGSPDIITFIPASYGAVWTAEMLQKPSLRAFHGALDRVDSKGLEYKIGITQIRAGLFLDYTFLPGLFGLDAKANKIELYKDALNNPFYISELGHLSRVIADVVLREPASIKNKNFYTYTFSPTGQELIDLFAAENRSAPTVDEYTDEQYEKDTEEPGLVMVAATYRKRWGERVWGWDEINAEWVEAEKPKETLQELAKPAFAK